jgi:hypothetical protein
VRKKRKKRKRKRHLPSSSSSSCEVARFLPLFLGHQWFSNSEGIREGEGERSGKEVRNRVRREKGEE